MRVFLLHIAFLGSSVVAGIASGGNQLEFPHVSEITIAAQGLTGGWCRHQAGHYTTTKGDTKLLLTIISPSPFFLGETVRELQRS